MIENTYILHEGPSVLDGEPIVVLATGFATASTNEKTGGLIQVYILRSDVPPWEAVKTGQDATICGNCPHRGHLGKDRSCYVRVYNAPRSLFEKYQRGGYVEIPSFSIFDGLKVRFGAYGDPAAAPLGLWESIAKMAKAWTGYTHQWRSHPELAPYCMASADSLQERVLAKWMGFRTFRVRGEDDWIKPNEITCPASVEAGKKTQCADCLLCMGSSTNSWKDITIVAHGSVTNKVRQFGIAA